MAIAGQLMIKMAADVAELRAGFVKAEKQVEQFGQRIASMGSAIKAAFAGIATSAVASFVKSSADAVGQLNDQAEAVGLTADTFLAYSTAAANAGVETDKFSGLIAKYIKLTEDAADGNKKAIETLDKWGIKILDSSGNMRSAEDRIRLLGIALDKVDDPAKKVQGAFELMGKGASKLLPAMGDLAKSADRLKTDMGISPQLNEAAREIDTITEKIENWIKLTRITLTVDAWKAITDWLKDNKKLIDDVADSWERLKREFSGDGTGQGTGGPLDATLSQRITATMQEIDDILNAIVNFKRWIDAWAAAFKGTTLERQEGAEAGGVFGGMVGGGIQVPVITVTPPPGGGANPPPKPDPGAGRRAEREAEKAAAEAVRQREKQMDALARIGERMKALADMFGGPTAKVAERIDELDEAMARGAISPERYGEALKSLQEQWQHARLEEMFGREVVDAIDAASQAFEQLGGSIYDAMFQGTGSIREFVANFLMQMGRMVFQMMVWTPIVKAFMALVSGWIAGPAPGGGATASAGAGVSAAPMAGGRQAGGPVWPGSAFMVGEHGPERFVPAVPGTIEPMGTSDTTVNIAITGLEMSQGNDATRAAELGRRIRAAVLDVIRTEKRPGGMLASGAGA